MIESKDFVSGKKFELKKENRKLVSFNGQSKILRISNKKVNKWHKF